LVIDNAGARLLEDFVKVMVIFEEATTLIGAEKYASASMLIPMFQAIRNSLASAAENETPEACTLRGAMSKSVEFYLHKYDYFDRNCLAALTFLDPRRVKHELKFGLL
jgi:hypothetical protein